MRTTIAGVSPILFSLSSCPITFVLQTIRHLLRHKLALLCILLLPSGQLPSSSLVRVRFVFVLDLRQSSTRRAEDIFAPLSRGVLLSPSHLSVAHAMNPQSQVDLSRRSLLQDDSRRRLFDVRDDINIPTTVGDLLQAFFGLMR